MKNTKFQQVIHWAIKRKKDGKYLFMKGPGNFGFTKHLIKKAEIYKSAAKANWAYNIKIGNWEVVPIRITINTKMEEAKM